MARPDPVIQRILQVPAGQEKSQNFLVILAQARARYGVPHVKVEVIENVGFEDDDDDDLLYCDSLILPPESTF